MVNFQHDMMDLYESFADRINQYYADILKNTKMTFRNFYEEESSWFIHGTCMRPLHLGSHKEIKEGLENFHPHANMGYGHEQIVFNAMEIRSDSVEEIKLVVKGAIEWKNSPVTKFRDDFIVKLIEGSYFIIHCNTIFVITEQKKVEFNRTKEDARFYFYKYQHILQNFFLSKKK